MNAAATSIAFGGAFYIAGTAAPSTVTAPTRGYASRRLRSAPPRALFLDFDGVLHPTTDGSSTDESLVRVAHFGWLPLLASALEPHREVQVVVHSTWRYTHDVDELRELLGVLGNRVVGATPRGSRYESILWWLHLNPQFTAYRVLDDDASEFPAPSPPELILCNPAKGVSEERVLTALKAWLQADLR